MSVECALETAVTNTARVTITEIVHLYVIKSLLRYYPFSKMAFS